MKLLTTLCCAAFALCSAIYAQSPNDHVVVHFSTPVMVGETKLPAGDCDIQVMRGSSDPIILVLRTPGGLTTMAVASHLYEGTESEGGPSVILNRHGDDLRVYRILFGDDTGYQLTNDQ
jgi:hypothetical protein